MMCHRIGLPPISIIGLGRTSVSSENRVPRPPASNTAFIYFRHLTRLKTGNIRSHDDKQSIDIGLDF